MLRIAIIAAISAVLVISALVFPIQNLIAQEVMPSEDDEVINAGEEPFLGSPPNQINIWPPYKSADTGNPITQHFDKILFKIRGKDVPRELKGKLLDVKVLDDPKEVASIDEKIRQVLLNNIRINGKFYNFTEDQVDRMKIKIEDVEYAIINKEPCIKEAEITYGVPDNFDPSLPEPAYIMRLWPLHVEHMPPRDFDDLNGPNRDFIHTIDLPDCLIRDAKVEMKLKAYNGDLPWTDWIGMFALDNVGNVCGSWSARMNDLAPGGRWDPGEEMTLTLDLRALPLFIPPPDGIPKVDLIPALNYCSGYLHIFIDDDTAVDYIRITIIPPS